MLFTEYAVNDIASAAAGEALNEWDGERAPRENGAYILSPSFGAWGITRKKN